MNKPQEEEIHPESPNDTLMACFSIFLSGSETRGHRNALRKRLLDHMWKNIFVDADTLHYECFTSPAVHAFVNRIHKIKPDEIPHSAELLYMRDEARFRTEASTFIAHNRREGFIGDMFTFCYLFSELHHVDVHLFQPEHVVLSAVKFAKYNIYLGYRNHRFHLLVAKCAPRVSYDPPMGIMRKMPKFNTPRYYIDKLCNLTPPHIEGYRVHHCMIYEAGLFMLSTDQHYKHYIYVYSKTGNRLALQSCMSHRGKTGARFYIDIVPCALFAIEEETQEEAIKAINIEIQW